MANTGNVDDLIQPRALINFVRLLDFFPVNTFESYFPVRPIDDIEYRYTKGQLLEQDAAVFRPYDTPAPLGKRQGFARMTGELPPISKKMTVGEEERLRLRGLQTGDYSPLVQQIYDDAANLARSIQIRFELARGELLSNGTVTINENGLVASYDAGVAANHKVVPAVNNWNNPAADILGDLRAWIFSSAPGGYIYDTRGLVPTQMLISRKTLNYMLSNTAIRQLAGNLLGAPLAVTRDQLNTILNNYDLPEIVVDDRMFPINGVTTRVVPENKVVLMPPSGQLGATLQGAPAEAITAAERGVLTVQEAPGIYAQTWQDNDPTRTWTLCSGIGLPVMPNPHLLMIATVY